MQQAVADWFRQRRLPRLLPDPALFRVGRDNSKALAELPGTRHGTTPKHGVSSHLRFLLGRHQVRDAVVQAAAFRFKGRKGFKQGLSQFLSQRAEGGGLTHYGLGVSAAVAGGQQVATVVAVRRRVRVDAVMASPGQPLRLCAKVVSGTRPRVVVTTPGGAVQHQAPALPGDHFCVRMPPTRKGVYQVEVMVDGPLGPEVAVLFPLHVGLPAPTMAVQKIYPPAAQHRKRVERQLLALVNAARRKARLAPLRPLGRLALVARTHSEDMRRSGFFGHRSPRHGSLADRLTAAGLRYTQASENLAISTGAAQAHDNLMSSPSHRRNIMDPRMTHLGIGVATDRHQKILYICQSFARLTP